MNQLSKKSFLPVSIFTVGAISFFLSLYMPAIKAFMYVQLVISFTYLFAGWHLFKAYYPEGHLILLIFLGYIYSTIFLAATFTAAAWPFAHSMAVVTPVWLIVLGLVIFLSRKKMPKEGQAQFFIEGLILLLISIMLIKSTI
jgi:hypothetical protein